MVSERARPHQGCGVITTIVRVDGSGRKVRRTLETGRLNSMGGLVPDCITEPKSRMRQTRRSIQRDGAHAVNYTGETGQVGGHIHLWRRGVLLAVARRRAMV